MYNNFEELRAQFVKETLAQEEVLHFHELLKSFRKATKMRQVELAEHVGKSQENISQYENKKHLPDSAADIILISNILGLPTSYIHQSIDVSRRNIVKKYKKEVWDLGEMSKAEFDARVKILHHGKEVDYDTFKKFLEIFAPK